MIQSAISRCWTEQGQIDNVDTLHKIFTELEITAIRRYFLKAIFLDTDAFMQERA